MDFLAKLWQKLRQKLREKKYLKKLIPHHRNLIRLTSFCPGQNAEGLVKFRQDPKHFRGFPILLFSEIDQALYEIAEAVIATEGLPYKFIIHTTKNKTRKMVPIKTRFLTLKVTAERISRISDLPRGRIRSFLFLEGEVAAEAISDYELLSINALS